MTADALLISTYALGQQPVALASAAAALRRAGLSVRTLDLAVSRLDEEALRSATFVGVHVPMHTALRVAVAALSRIRSVAPSCHVCMFGTYAGLNADHLFGAHGVDTVIAGEVEQPLVELLGSLQGDAPIRGVMRPGTPAGTNLMRPDYPVPDRRGLPPLSKYVALVHGERRAVVGGVETTRGCKYLCRHCPLPGVYGGRFFAVPRDVVLADIDNVVAAGAEHITFTDPDFLNGPSHALRVVQAMHARHPQLTYDFTARVDHLTAACERLEVFRQTGCVFVVSAVESFDDTVLDALGKGHTSDDARRLAEVMRRSGIALRPTFVPFTPWLSLEGYRELLRTVRVLGWAELVDPVQYSIRLLVPPGSLLVGADAMAPHLGELDGEGFTWRWRHPDPRMDLLQAAVAEFIGEVVTRLDPAEIGGEPLLDALDAMVTAAAQERPLRGRVELVRAGAFAAPRPPRLTEPWFC